MTFPRLLFIAGTDTGVGKTRVTGLLAAGLSNAGLRAGVVKAVQTGCERRDDRLIAPDLAEVARLAGWPADDGRLSLGRGFEPACSPHLAARMAGCEIDAGALDEVVRDALDRQEHVLVEGAGGLLAPLRDDLLFIDWIPRWNAPVLLVARAGLGTINHTLLSADSLRTRGIPLAGLVLNDAAADAPEWIAADNAAFLARALRVPVARLPFRADRAAAEKLLSDLGLRASS